MRFQRFGVGFISALIFPLIKLVQGGTVVQMNVDYILGLLLLPFLLSVLVGFYAVIVEKQEENMARLFRICVALPAFVTNLAQGEAPNLTAPAHAAAPAPEIFEVKCEKRGMFTKGFEQAWATITGTDDKRYWWVKKTRPTLVDKYVIVNGDPWWILGMSGEKPDYLPFYDSGSCELITVDFKAATK